MNRLIFIFFSFLAFPLWSQELNGRVMSLDAQGNMADIPGATVYYQADRLGTTTGVDGLFKLRIRSLPGWLVIRAIGFNSDSLSACQDIPSSPL